MCILCLFIHVFVIIIGSNWLSETLPGMAINCASTYSSTVKAISFKSLNALSISNKNQQNQKLFTSDKILTCTLPATHF